jgi:lysophospholipase L1-like esterase
MKTRFVFLLPLLAAFAASATAELAAPTLSRDPNGGVIITGSASNTIVRYSLDSSDPTAKSGAYLAPILLPAGGSVKARAFSADRKEKSALAEAKYDALPGATNLPSTLVPCTQSRDWPKYDWEQRHAAICALVKELKPQLVFIGDSITHFWGGAPHDKCQRADEVWNKFYGERKALNLGYGWDRTENVIWRLQHGELDGATPKVAVIMIGTNNRDLNTPKDIAAGVRAICAEVRKISPPTKILLLAVFPRGAKPDAGRLKTDELNKLLAQFDGKDGVTFLDIGARFLNADGSISSEIMKDYLHPTEKGYAIWSEAMEPTLRRLLE